MLRILAIFFGLVFLIIGVLGFIPEARPDGKLFGLFEVSTVHNFVYIATGVVGLLAGLKSAGFAKIFFILLGLIYLAFASYGFYHGEGFFFGLFSLNNADNWFHAIIAAISLYIGLTFPTR